MKKDKGNLRASDGLCSLRDGAWVRAVQGERGRGCGRDGGDDAGEHPGL